MAEDLRYGDFWLPSEFLTDDDILMDFSVSGSSETSDDDCLVDAKAVLLSTSPQSTLFGFDSNHQGSTPTDAEEMNGFVDQKISGGDGSATFDLLNKAAGVVAKMKTKIGTGFFDCSFSAKGLLCPPPPSQQPPQRTTPVFPPPQFYSHPHHFRQFPPMMWVPGQIPTTPRQQQPNKATKNNKSNNRPLGLPPSAWPPLPGQAQAQAEAEPQTQAQAQAQAQQQAMPVMGMSVGTGVFLPRTVAAPADPKKKSDGTVMKTKNTKGSNRRNGRLTKAKADEIQLPSEWVY